MLAAWTVVIVRCIITGLATEELSAEVSAADWPVVVLEKPFTIDELEEKVRLLGGCAQD